MISQKSAFINASGLKIMLSVMIISASFLSGYAYKGMALDLQQERQLDGLNIRGANYEYVKNRTIERDKYGDWVCVNVKDMPYSRAVEVCNHEVAHEIFAEFCEKDDNMNKCMEITKNEL